MTPEQRKAVLERMRIAHGVRLDVTMKIPAESLSALNDEQRDALFAGLSKCWAAAPRRG